VELGELAGNGSPMEFIDCLLRQVLPASDVDSLEPALLTPAPRGARGYADCLYPFGKANDRGPGGRMCLVIEHYHTKGKTTSCDDQSGVLDTRFGSLSILRACELQLADHVLERIQAPDEACGYGSGSARRR
jgi:hypothetical protein